MGLVAWFCVWCWAALPAAMGQQSPLKVAACNPGSVPYVTTDSNGKLIGYDIGEGIGNRKCYVSALRLFATETTFGYS